MSTPDELDALAGLLGSRTATITPNAISAAIVAELRERLARIGYRRYALLDRGSYEYLDDALDAGRARALFGDAIGPVRALRLGPGDYLLAHHDHLHDHRQVELVLDVSAAAVPGAEVHYRRRGQLFHRAPSQPGALSTVERDGAVTCHHTYVSRRYPAAEIVRLVARRQPGR